MINASYLQFLKDLCESDRETIANFHTPDICQNCGHEGHLDPWIAFRIAVPKLIAEIERLQK